MWVLTVSINLIFCHYNFTNYIEIRHTGFSISFLTCTIHLCNFLKKFSGFRFNISTFINTYFNFYMTYPTYYLFCNFLFINCLNFCVVTFDRHYFVSLLHSYFFFTCLVVTLHPVEVCKLNVH